MSPHTCSSLSEVLKTVWTEDNMRKQFGWNKLMDLEYEDGMKDFRRDMNRQLFNTLPTQEYIGRAYTMPMNIDMSPRAVRERNRRNQEMMQRLARINRKGKPSYRQRQKNARAAKG